MGSLLGKLAWRNAWRNRRRSLITAAAVAFSVTILVFTEALLVGSHEQMALQALDTYKVGQIQVQARGYQEDPTIFKGFVPPPRLLDSLRENRELAGFAPRVQGEGLAAVGQESRGVLIVGIDPELEKRIMPIAAEITQGDYLATEDLEGALVGDGLLKNLGAEPGASLALIAQTRHGSLGAVRVQIRGVFHTSVPALDDGLVYLHIKSTQQLFAFGDRVTLLAIKLRDPSPAKLNRVRRALLAEVGPAELEVLTWPELMPELVQLLRLDSASGYLFLLILLLVIAFGMLNTILMAVLERTREVGVLLSLGTRPRRLFGMILLEALFIALIGAAAGALLGSGVSAYVVHHPLNLAGSSMESFESWGIEPLLYARLNFEIVIYPTLVVLGLGVLTVIWPAWRAARIEPVMALHSV